MHKDRKKYEIDHHTIKLIIGIIAISLAFLTHILSIWPINSINELLSVRLHSISDSYHHGEWSRNVLVGSLFAISAFLFAYNGKSVTEMALSKAAAIASLGIALFPCGCEGHQVSIRFVHGSSAAVMFVILAAFCFIFFRRASAKGHSHARFRAWTYIFCGVLIVASIITIALHHHLSENQSDNLVFFAEAVGLIFFGIAWLIASRILPLITRRDERCSLLPKLTS